MKGDTDLAGAGSNWSGAGNEGAEDGQPEGAAKRLGLGITRPVPDPRRHGWPFARSSFRHAPGRRPGGAIAAVMLFLTRRGSFSWGAGRNPEVTAAGSYPSRLTASSPSVTRASRQRLRRGCGHRPDRAARAAPGGRRADDGGTAPRISDRSLRIPAGAADRRAGRAGPPGATHRSATDTRRIGATRGQTRALEFHRGADIPDVGACGVGREPGCREIAFRPGLTRRRPLLAERDPRQDAPDIRVQHRCRYAVKDATAAAVWWRPPRAGSGGPRGRGAPRRRSRTMTRAAAWGDGAAGYPRRSQARIASATESPASAAGVGQRASTAARAASDHGV